MHFFLKRSYTVDQVYTAILVGWVGSLVREWNGHFEFLNNIAISNVTTSHSGSQFLFSIG